MKTTRRLSLAAAGLLGALTLGSVLPSVPTVAQAAGVDSFLLGTGSARGNDLAPGALCLGLAGRLAGPAHGSLLYNGAGARSPWELNSDLRLETPTAPSTGIRARVAVEGQSRSLGADRRATAGRVTPVVAARLGKIELQAGPTWAGGTTGGAWSSSTGVAWGLGGAAGALSFSWEGHSGAAHRSTSYLRPESPADSFISPADRTVATRRNYRYWDTQFRLGYAARAWRANGALGCRLGRDPFGPRAFGGVDASYSLGGGLCLVAASRFEPSVPEQHLPARHAAQFGLSLDRLPWGSRSTEAKPAAAVSPFRITALGSATTEIACRVGEARRVLASGDFSDWSPREMESGPDGWWRLRLPLEPGPHRISLSIDGGDWVAPRGVPTATDDFGGTVGLFVAP